MIKIEQMFLTAFRKNYLEKHPGAFYFKIPDSPTRFQVAKPFDSFTVYNNGFTVYEAKVKKGHESIKFTDLRQSQVDGLSRAADNGAEAYVLGYYPEEGGYIKVTYKYLELYKEVPFGQFPIEKIKI